MLDLLKKIEAESTLDGSLQVERVEGFIKTLGRDMALRIYTEKLVNRFLPAPEDTLHAEPKSVSGFVTIEGEDTDSEHS